MNQNDDECSHKQERNSGAVDCGVEEGGRSNIGDLSNQGPDQTFLGDCDSAMTCIKGIEGNCPERAQGILNEAEDAQREKEQVKHQGTFGFGQSAAGESQNHESVYQ